MRNQGLCMRQVIQKVIKCVKMLLQRMAVSHCYIERRWACVLKSDCVCAAGSKSPRPWDWEAGTTYMQACFLSRMFLLKNVEGGNIFPHSHPILPPINIWLLLDPIKRLICRAGSCSVARMTICECICIMYERYLPSDTDTPLPFSVCPQHPVTH